MQLSELFRRLVMARERSTSQNNSKLTKLDLGVDVDISNTFTEWTGHTTKDVYRDVCLTLPNGEKIHTTAHQAA